METFASLVKNRRSIRQYTPEKLTAEEVEQIMKSALMSPSSKRSTPWQFVLVEDKDMLQQLSQSRSSGANFLADCALAVVVLTNPMQSTCPVEDATIAATYIQLQVEDLGLGSCWVHINGRETATGQDSEDYVRQLLDIPLQLVVECIIAIGRKENAGKPFDESRLQWEKLHIGKYNYSQHE